MNRKRIISMLISTACIMATTACGDVDEPQGAMEVTGTENVVTDSDNENMKTQSKEESNISDDLPNKEEMKRDLDYLNSVIHEEIGDGFMYGEKTITPSDNIWYSDPIVVYCTNNGIDVYTDKSYAYIIIDKDNNEVIGMENVWRGDLDRNINLGIEECYTDSLRSGKPIAIVVWDRAEGYSTILCVTDGKAFGSFGAEILDTLDVSTFDVDYTEISAVHQAAPAKQ